MIQYKYKWHKRAFLIISVSIPKFFICYLLFLFRSPLGELAPLHHFSGDFKSKKKHFHFPRPFNVEHFHFLLFYHAKHFQQPYYVEHFHFLQLFLLKLRTLSPGIFLKKLHSSIAKHEIWNLEDWKVNIQNLFWHCGRFKYPIECNPMLCSQDAIYNHLWLCNM